MGIIDYIAAMPKVELHVHLEGTVQPTTLFDLAKKNNVPLPVNTVDELKSWYTFRDFDHFVEIFVTISKCLQAPDDFTRITYEYGQMMALQNIQYAEVTWTPHTHVRTDLPFTDLLAAINAGRAQAKQAFGVEMRWIPDIARCFPETAEPVVAWLTTPEARTGGIIALGLGGPEVGFPPELFEDAFREARAKGLPGNPHAGETVGPDSIWGAIKSLKAQRLGHGVRAIEDPELLTYLVESQLPLETNPTSNICLGVYPSYTEHPLKQLVEAGACVTVNTDDPALFNTTLNDEYIHATQDCGLSLNQLEKTALNAVRASYLPDSTKITLAKTFREEYEQLRIRFKISERDR